MYILSRNSPSRIKITKHLCCLHGISGMVYRRDRFSVHCCTVFTLCLFVAAGCKEHPPWPRGICSKCQPGAVTLNRQPYRHVDNVVVEHPALVERFLAYWRASTHQRLGYLYGQYEPHPDVPLGECERYRQPCQKSVKYQLASKRLLRVIKVMQ